MHHSFSSMKLFDQCPAQYHAVKVAKLYPYRATPATEFGVRAHAAMENAVRHKLPLPDEFQPYQWVVDDFLGALGPEPQAEVSFDFDAEWGVVGKREWDRKRFSGQADLIDIVGTHALVLDWKFTKNGNWKYAEEDQLALMALFTMTKWAHVERVTGLLVFVNDGRVVPDDGSATWTRADLPRLRAKWEGKASKIEQHAEMGVWPTTPNNLCAYCPHTVCPNHAPAVAKREAKAARFSNQ